MLTIPNRPDLDYAKTHREAMEHYVYDAVTIPSQQLTGPISTILSEEKQLCNKLRLIFRSHHDIDSGLVRSWKGPRRDQLTLL